MSKRKRMGEIAETKVEIVIKGLEREGKIDSWSKSGKLNRDDIRGVDFFLTYNTPNGSKKTVLLQVKSRITESLVKKLGLKEIQPGIWYEGGERIYNIEAGGGKLRSEVKKKILKILEIEKEA